MLHRYVRNRQPSNAIVQSTEHAEHYGLRHEVVARTGGDLLDRVTERGKWPSHRNRWCTVDCTKSSLATKELVW